MPQELCPCGSKKAERYCCGMYLSGKKKPETAEKLMRSRYTAFYRGDVDYLIATLDPGKRQPEDRAELTKSIAKTKWLGLTILNTQQGKKNDTSGIVEFEAVFQANELGQLHERSRFVKSNGQWFYVDGDILPGTVPKPKDPCWCRSGKKYRQCHGQKSEVRSQKSEVRSQKSEVRSQKYTIYRHRIINNTEISVSLAIGLNPI